jgi:hypothetical protein
MHQKTNWWCGRITTGGRCEDDREESDVPATLSARVSLPSRLASPCAANMGPKPSRVVRRRGRFLITKETVSESHPEASQLCTEQSGARQKLQSHQPRSLVWTSPTYRSHSVPNFRLSSNKTVPLSTSTLRPPCAAPASYAACLHSCERHRLPYYWLVPLHAATQTPTLRLEPAYRSCEGSRLPLAGMLSTQEDSADVS